jgi:hypothetical protein
MPAAAAAAAAAAAGGGAEGAGGAGGAADGGAPTPRRRPFARLRRLDLSGCEALRPPLPLLGAAAGLAALSLASTPTEDFDLEVIAGSLPRLRHLDVSGCTLLTDDGARALASAPALAAGRLTALGLGRLPRVTAAGLCAVMAAWGDGWRAAAERRRQRRRQANARAAAGARCARRECGGGSGGGSDSGGWGSSCSGHSSDGGSSDGGSSDGGSSDSGSESGSSSGGGGGSNDDSDSGSSDSDGAPATAHAWQRRRRRRRGRSGGAGSLWLDVSGCGAFDGRALAELLRAAAEPRRLVACAPVPGPSHAGAAAADEAAELLASLGLCALDERAADKGPAAAAQTRPRLRLRGLLAAGCRLGPEDLLALAASGCLRSARALDLSHCEPLRKPAPCGGGEGAGAEPHPLVALLAPRPPPGAANGGGGGGGRPPRSAPRALRALRLDAVHLTDAAAVALAPALGPSLRELSVVACRPLGNAGLHALAAACTRLWDLSVGGGGPHAWDEASALGGSPALAGLARLSVSRRAGLGDAGLAALLVGAPRLRALRLAGCYSVTDRGLAAAPLGLREVAAVGMDASFTGAPLARLTALRAARLSACPGVTPAAAQLVAACCPQLAELRLPGHLAGLALPGGRGACGGAGPQLRVEFEA